MTKRPCDLDNACGPLEWDKPQPPTIEEIQQATPGMTDKDIADIAQEITKDV